MSNSDEMTGPSSLKSPNLQHGSVGPGASQGAGDDNDMMLDAGEQMDTMMDNGVNSVGGIGSVNGVNDSMINDNNPNSLQNNGGPNAGQFDHERNPDFEHGDGFRFYQEDFFDAYNFDDEEDFYDQYEKFTKSGGGADGHAMNGVWLVAPLILRLPYTCQIKVLDNAGKLKNRSLKKLS